MLLQLVAALLRQRLAGSQKPTVLKCLPLLLLDQALLLLLRQAELGVALPGDMLLRSMLLGGTVLDCLKLLIALRGQHILPGTLLLVGSSAIRLAFVTEFGGAVVDRALVDGMALGDTLLAGALRCSSLLCSTFSSFALLRQPCGLLMCFALTQVRLLRPLRDRTLLRHPQRCLARRGLLLVVLGLVAGGCAALLRMLLYARLCMRLCFGLRRLLLCAVLLLVLIARMFACTGFGADPERERSPDYNGDCGPMGGVGVHGVPRQYNGQAFPAWLHYAARPLNDI